MGGSGGGGGGGGGLTIRPQKWANSEGAMPVIYTIAKAGSKPALCLYLLPQPDARNALSLHTAFVSGSPPLRLQLQWWVLIEPPLGCMRHGTATGPCCLQEEEEEAVGWGMGVDF